MADAKKCDRCGEFYEERVIECKRSCGNDDVRPLNGTLRVYEDCTNRGFYYDLCPTCFKELMAFLHIEEVKEDSEKENLPMCKDCVHFIGEPDSYCRLFGRGIAKVDSFCGNFVREEKNVKKR